MSRSSNEPAQMGMALVRFPYLKSTYFFKVHPQGTDELTLHAFQKDIHPEIKLKGSFEEASPLDFDAFESTRKSLIDNNAATEIITHSDWNRIGEKALNLLNNKVLDKIVLSRIIDLQDEGSVSLYSSFEQLGKEFPHALVYLFYHPDAGMWMGATPELLLKWENGYLETVSLAGTRRHNGKPDEKWGAKERNEHQCVTDEIARIFLNNGIPFTLTDPYTFPSGDIEHLKQDFKSKSMVQQSDYDELLLELHPTPAVCGSPCDQALKHILELEPHDRKYYTGYISIKMDDRLQSFVNLRCAEVHKNSFSFYVGGGWTADSKIEQEWQETLDKYKSTARIFETPLNGG